MMQWSAESPTTNTPSGVMPGSMGESGQSSGGLYAQANMSDIKIIRRNGAVVGFEPSKIQVAMTKAFLAVQGNQGAASARVREITETLTNQVVMALLRRLPAGGTLHIEDIQDQVELGLMRSGEHEVARAYVLYRERRAQERAAKQKADPSSAEQAPALRMLVDGQPQPLNQAWLRDIIALSLKRTLHMQKLLPACCCTRFARKSCRLMSRRPRWPIVTKSTSPDSSRRASRLAY
jgi:ribonucleoside-diphosphate reductase alpha chain